MGMRSVADAVAGEGENMRIFRLAVIVGGFGLALAGCTSTSGGTAGGSPSPTAPTGVASSSGGAVPACLVGTCKATPTSDTAGTFEPTGTVDWSSLTVTVELSSPIKAKVFDNVKISDVAGTGAAQAGNAVDTTPILRKNMYDCGGTTLKLSPPSGITGGGTWTFQKS